MKKHQQMTVRVNGAGNSKQKAFSVALSQVQRELLKNNSNIILRIEPIDVQVVSALSKETTEKFLFFFLPRKKVVYEISVDITVDVSFVEMNDIEFITQ